MFNITFEEFNDLDLDDSETWNSIKGTILHDLFNTTVSNLLCLDDDLTGDLPFYDINGNYHGKWKYADAIKNYWINNYQSDFESDSGTGDAEDKFISAGYVKNNDYKTKNVGLAWCIQALFENFYYYTDGNEKNVKEVDGHKYTHFWWHGSG